MVILENRKDGYDPHLDSKIDIYLYLFDGRGVCKTKSGYADSWGSDIFVWQNGSVINSAPDAPGGAISIRQRENGMIGNDTESKFCYSMFFIGSLTELEKHKQDGDRKIRQLLEATR
jgi:hypothetical protein